MQIMEFRFRINIKIDIAAKSNPKRIKENETIKIIDFNKIQIKCCFTCLKFQESDLFRLLYLIDYRELFEENNMVE